MAEGVRYSQLAAIRAEDLTPTDQIAVLDVENNTLKRANISHASDTDQFGLGNISNYGHVKTENDLNAVSYVDGVALSARQGRVLADIVSDSYEPSNTASNAHTVGSYFIWKDTFVQATANIAAGSTISASNTVATCATAEIGKALPATKWTAVIRCRNWSSICHIVPHYDVEGTSGILSISATRANVVVNATFLVTTSHAGATASSVQQLGANCYSTPTVRIGVNINGNFYFQINDSQASATAEDYQSYHCVYMPLLPSDVTAYTTYHEGNVLPEGYEVYGGVGGFQGICQALGAGAHAEGHATKAHARASHAEGFITSATAQGAHSEGAASLALGENAHAEGDHTTASFQAAHTEGYYTSTGEAAGYAHAEGQNSSAVGQASHSEGVACCAKGSGAHAEGVNTSTIASGGHSEGYATVASRYAHAEGWDTAAVNDCANSSGKSTTASGLYSHAEGETTTASGTRSHSEGYNTLASGGDSHAEGSSTRAVTTGAHAEGYNTTVNGGFGHAEGHSTISAGQNAHSEGIGTTASGTASHSGGNHTIASGDYSHSLGYYTTASNFASLSTGHYPTAMTDGGSSVNMTGTAFVIGNGKLTAPSNAFSVQYDGTVRTANTITASTAADYAEFFEWFDNNPGNDDRVGHFVTFLSKRKIKIAEPEDDYVLGVVSGQPFVLGNGDCDVWNGMYVRDKFGRIEYEPVPKYECDSKTGKIDVVHDENGNPVYEGMQPKINPEYDPTKKYISRMDRPEWAPIGMLGVLAVLDDGNCRVNGYATIGRGGIAVPAKEDSKFKYRIVGRRADDVIEIVFK